LFAGSFCLTTVPMTDAMQMTVRSEIANRIDESNSTTSRHAREPWLTSRPAVEVVTRGIIPAHLARGLPEIKVAAPRP
jgi:hypothetical protein